MFSTNNKSNIQDFLKLLALVAMMIDHYGMYMNNAEIYRVIGRFALPVFAFYTGYNFHGKMRHIIWILGAILIGLHMYILDHFITNVLITLAFGQLYLTYAGKAILADEQTFLRHFVGMLILMPLVIPFMDYGTVGIAWMMVGYKFHNGGRRDEGYLLLATLCVIIFNEYSFEKMNYSLWSALGAVAMASLSALFLKYANHEKPIPVDIRLITRNMLYIYFVSIVGLLGVVYSRIYI